MQQSNAEAQFVFDSKSISESNSKTTILNLINQVSKLEVLVSRLNIKLDNYIATSPPKLFYTREEVCKMLNVTLPTLNAWEKGNILKPIRIGTRVRYTLEAINKAFTK